VQAWDRWIALNKAMARAGKVMNRVMCRFTSAQLVAGWERWMEVLEAQQHAGVVMERCLGRILNAAMGPAMGKWAEVVDYEKQEHIRRHGIDSATEAQFEIVAKLKSRLFVIYLTVFRLRMITGAFLTWNRFMHLAANQHRAAKDAAKAAAAAGAAVVAAKRWSLAAAHAAKGDAVSQLLGGIGMGGKKLTAVQRLQSQKTVIRMLQNKAKDDTKKGDAHALSGRDFILDYFEVKHGKTAVAKRKVDEFLQALASSEVMGVGMQCVWACNVCGHAMCVGMQCVWACKGCASSKESTRCGVSMQCVRFRLFRLLRHSLPSHSSHTHPSHSSLLSEL
jgi:hypothetical protein